MGNPSEWLSLTPAVRSAGAALEKAWRELTQSQGVELPRRPSAALSR